MHDIAIINEGFKSFMKLSRSLKDRVEIADARVEISEELRKAGKAREAKLKEEL